MELYRRNLNFPLLCVVIGLTVFGVAYTVLGQGPGDEDDQPPPGNVGDNPAPGDNPIPGGPDEGEIGPVGRVTDGDKLVTALALDENHALQDLLEAGSDPNSLTTDGHLPLHMAVYSTSTSETAYGKIQLLIRYGANPNQPDRKGSTPMDAAAMAGTEAIMKAFLDAGGDPHLSVNGSLTPYESAFAFGKDGPLAAIKQAFPNHVPADKKRLRGFESARIINKNFDKAFLLTGKDQDVQIRKMVDELVRNGNIPAEDADVYYKGFLEQMKEYNERVKEIQGQ